MTRHRAATPGGENSSRISFYALAFAALVSGMGVTGCQAINIRLAMNEGVGHFKAKNYELAAESFKQAIRLDPRYSEAYLDLGLTYMELYEPGSTHPKDLQYADGAIESFKRYIRLDPENGKVKDYLINVCSTSGRMDEAIGFFMEDYDRNPNDLNLVRMIGALHHRAGDTLKAIEWFSKAAQLDQENPEAWYSVGVSCWGHSYHTPYMEYEERMAILDQGLEALEKAKSLRAGYFEALSYESLSYREKMKYDISPAQAVEWRRRADEAFQKALELRNAAMSKQAAETAGTPAGGSSVPASNPEPGPGAASEDGAMEDHVPASPGTGEGDLAEPIEKQPASDAGL